MVIHKLRQACGHQNKRVYNGEADLCYFNSPSPVIRTDVDTVDVRQGCIGASHVRRLFYQSSKILEIFLCFLNGHVKMTADEPFGKKKRFPLRSFVRRIAVNKRSMAVCLLPPSSA